MDVYRIAPLGAPVDATVWVPGSKSVANRALVCAALAEGTTVLAGLPDGDDTVAMLACLEGLGLEIDRGVDEVTVEGGRSRMRRFGSTLDARLAGTTSRFTTALAALAPGPVRIDGGDALRRRPMGPLHDALTALGVTVRPLGAPGHLPVEVEGPFDPDADEVTISGDISSQFLSALMLVAPYQPKGLRFHLSSPLVSRPYVRMTAGVMASFGVDGVEIGDRIISVPAGSYGARRFEVEADASSASYPLAAAAICGGRITVEGLGAGSMQGDASFCHVLERMGCEVQQTESRTTVRRTGGLRGITVDMADVSDLVPTLAVVAAFASGTTEIHGVGFIRAKESDRVGDLCAELRAAGVGAEERPDGLVVHPGEMRAAQLGTHHDHRLAMSFALLGLGTSGIAVEDPDVVGKSWPDFWQMIEGLR